MIKRNNTKRKQATIYFDDDITQVLEEIMEEYNLNLNEAVRVCVKHSAEMYRMDNNVNTDLTLSARIFAGAKKAVYKHDIQKRVDNGYCR